MSTSGPNYADGLAKELSQFCWRAAERSRDTTRAKANERLRLMGLGGWVAGGYARDGSAIAMAAHLAETLLPNAESPADVMIVSAGIFAFLESQQFRPIPAEFERFDVVGGLPIDAARYSQWLRKAWRYDSATPVDPPAAPARRARLT